MAETLVLHRDDVTDIGAEPGAIMVGKHGLRGVRVHQILEGSNTVTRLIASRAKHNE